MYHNIKFVEPVTYNPKDIFDKSVMYKPIKIDEKMSQIIDINDTIKVNEKMYQLILKGGKRFDTEDHNAYIFGNFFDFSTYKHLVFQDNEYNQIGFIDIDLPYNYTKKWKKTIKTLHNGDPDDSEYIKSLRSINPAILWVGETKNSCNAELWIHIDKNNEINSMIVDVYCFFNEYE